MIKNPKVLVCYNEPVRYYENYIGKNINSNEENIDLSESEFSKHIEKIVNHLKTKFNDVDTLPVNSNIASMISSLSYNKPDIIFNFVESIEGNSHYESYVAGLFDILGISFTGNNALALGNCLIKTRTKHILKSFNVRTPDFFHARYIKAKVDISGFNLNYPVIAKLLHEDASIGISEFSVIRNKKELINRLTFLFNTYKQDVLVEEFIEGRELNVSVLGNTTLPISEILFTGLPDSYPKIITYEAKWSPESIYYKNTVPSCPAVLDSNVTDKVREIAIRSFNALGCRDYARVDIRLDKKNVPHVIEVNPNPDISFDSGFVRSASAAGISYDELLYTIAGFAIERIKYDQVAEER